MKFSEQAQRSPSPNAATNRLARTTVLLQRRPLRLRRRTNELRLADGHLIFDLASRLREPYVVPVAEVAGVARATRASDFDSGCRLARRPQVPRLVDHHRVVPSLLVVFAQPQPVPSWRGRLSRSMASGPIDGFLIAPSDNHAAVAAFSHVGVAVSEADDLLDDVIGLELDPRRVGEAVVARRRARALMLTGIVMVGALMVAILAMMPGSLLRRGCPDSSPTPVSAVTEPVLAPLDGSELELGGTRTVPEVLRGRAKEDDLLAAATDAGAHRAWSETWKFPDADQVTLDQITFEDAAGASSYGDFDTTHGCPHKIASYPLGDTGVTAVRANRPSHADGFEAIVVQGRDVYRLYIVSGDEARTLHRLQLAVEILHER